MPTPEELREEARAAEEMARVVSYAPDRRWLAAKAEALRQQADRQEQTAHRPRKR
jgi:hypothetical protein